MVTQLVISGAALDAGSLVRELRFLPSGQTAGGRHCPGGVGWGSRQKTDSLSDGRQLGNWREMHRPPGEQRAEGRDQAWPGAGGLMRVLNKFKSSLQFFLLLEYILLAKIEKTIFVVA